jgi:hypothetical protein
MTYKEEGRKQDEMLREKKQRQSLFLQQLSNLLDDSVIEDDDYKTIEDIQPIMDVIADRLQKRSFKEIVLDYIKETSQKEMKSMKFSSEKIRCFNTYNGRFGVHREVGWS